MNPDPQLDHAVREWAISTPRLRKDVGFSFHQRRGKPVYVVEDLVHRRYFQVGVAEYQFIQSLNGKRTVSEALAMSARGLGAGAISEQDGLTLVSWLVDNELLETENADQNRRRFDHAQERMSPAKKNQSWLKQMLFLRIPLGNPDSFLAGLVPVLGWIFTKAALVVWLGLISYALYLAGANWTSLAQQSSNVILPGNWIIMLVVFAVLKVIHELGHGIATRKFGGAVPEWGVQLLIFVTPLTFVDATSSWRFPRRRDRMAVAAAGMYVELGVAAMAMIVWDQTAAGMANTIAYNVVITASFITLLFNGNPLMRFDGYYILADLLNISNLGQKGQTFLKWAAQRLLLGMKEIPLPSQCREQPWAIGIYGILAALWRIVIWIGIMIIVSLLGRGAGIVLVAITVAGLIFAAIKGLVSLFRTEGRGAKPKPGRVAVRMGILIGVVALSFYAIRFQPYTRAVAVITYADKEVIRAELEGFVEMVSVENGQVVEKGDILARLFNPDRQTQLKTVRLDIATSELRSRQFLQNGQVAAHQAELDNLAGLREKMTVLQRMINSLTVRAPISGIVFVKRPETLPGRFLRQGTEILTVMPESRPEVVISAKQRAVNALSTGANVDLKVRLKSRPMALDANLKRVESKATVALPHPALASTSGGPLAVRQRAEAESERERGLAKYNRSASEELGHFADLDGGNSPQGLELTSARFAAYADLIVDEEVQLPLREGEFGYVRIREQDRQRLGSWLWQEFKKWVEDKWSTARSV